MLIVHTGEPKTKNSLDTSGIQSVGGHYGASFPGKILMRSSISGCVLCRFAGEGKLLPLQL